MTQAYLEQVTGLPGDAAVTACLQTASEPALLADGVEVSDVVIDGDDATALVDLRRLDALRRDRSRSRSSRWTASGSSTSASPSRASTARRSAPACARPSPRRPRTSPEEGADCAADRILALSKAGLESTLISSDTSAYAKAIIVCDRASYLDSLVADLTDTGYSEELAACVRDELDRGSDDALVALLDDPVAYTEIAIGCDRDAVLRAYGDLVVADGAGEEAGRCVVAHLGELSDNEIARTSVECRRDRPDLRRVRDRLNGSLCSAGGRHGGRSGVRTG